MAAAATTAVATMAGCPIEPAPPRDEYPFPYHHDAFGGDGNVVRQLDYQKGNPVVVAWARPQASLAVAVDGQGILRGVHIETPFGDGARIRRISRCWRALSGRAPT